MLMDTNWPLVLYYVFVLSFDADGAEKLADAGCFDDANAELTGNGFRITFDHGSRVVDVELFRNTVFVARAAYGICDRGMVNPSQQENALYMFDAIVDRLLAA